MRFIGTLVVLCVVAATLAEDMAAPAPGDTAAGPAAAEASTGADATGAAATPPPAPAAPAAGDAVLAAALASAGAAGPAVIPDMSGEPAGANETAPIAQDDLSGNKVEAAAAPVTPAAATAPFVPYKFDCSGEVDDSGPKCTEWAKSGFCEKHKATKFLFCRKTCLCTGPGGPK